MDYQMLGRRIREKRKLLKLTQEELAEQVMISTSFMGHIERGGRKVSMDTFVDLCRALRTTPDELLQDSLADCAYWDQPEGLDSTAQKLNDIMRQIRELIRPNI